VLTVAGGAKGRRRLQPPIDGEGSNISSRTRSQVRKSVFVKHLHIAKSNFSESTPPPQFKLDIRNDPIQEEDGDASEALAHVANTLRLVSLTSPHL
jgi:hypothetical protein